MIYIKINIIEIEIDKEKISEPNNIYTFKNPGNHNVYILLDIKKINFITFI